MAAGDRAPDLSRGEQKIGSRRQQSGLAIESAPGTRGYIKLTSAAGADFYLYVANSGNLVITTSLAAVLNGTGVVVGNQT